MKIRAQENGQLLFVLKVSGMKKEAMTHIFGGVDVGAALDEHVGAALAILDAGGDVQRCLLVRSTLDLHLYAARHN